MTDEHIDVRLRQASNVINLFMLNRRQGPRGIRKLHQSIYWLRRIEKEYISREQERPPSAEEELLQSIFKRASATHLARIEKKITDLTG